MYSLREVKCKKDLNRFIDFPFELYKDNVNWVPPLKADERIVLSKKKNPAFDHCRARYWLAIDPKNNTVGRIAGILHEKESKHKKLLRFGWIDFIEDIKVAELLLQQVRNWGKDLCLKGMHGPLGFTDMDYEGMLVDGFDTPGTIATLYNYKYYPKYLELLGFKKSVDWLEVVGSVPYDDEKIIKRIERRAQMVESRFKYKSLYFKSKKELKLHGQEVFKVLNEAYSRLFGFYQLTSKQIEFYIDQYFGFIQKDFVCAVVNEKNDIVGFAITMPSLSRAFQKAKGSLYPFGFIHILTNIKRSNTADMYLFGVLPEHQKYGVSSLLVRDLLRAFKNNGIKTAVSNQMLENNQKILTQFNDFQVNSRIHKRRRCYIISWD